MDHPLIPVVNKKFAFGIGFRILQIRPIDHSWRRYGWRTFYNNDWQVSYCHNQTDVTIMLRCACWSIELNWWLYAIGKEGKKLLGHAAQARDRTSSIKFLHTDVAECYLNPYDSPNASRVEFLIEVNIRKIADGMKILRCFKDQVSDVTLLVKEQKFDVLRQFLAHCKLFDLLLMETKDPKFNVDPDLEIDEVQSFLEVLYGEKVTEDNLRGVYKCAIRFECQMVVDFCERHLIKESTKYVCEQFEIAELGYRKKELQGTLIDNIEELSDLCSFLPRDRHEMGSQLMAKLLEKSIELAERKGEKRSNPVDSDPTIPSPCFRNSQLTHSFGSTIIIRIFEEVSVKNIESFHVGNQRFYPLHCKHLDRSWDLRVTREDKSRYSFELRSHSQSHTNSLKSGTADVSFSIIGRPQNQPIGQVTMAIVDGLADGSQQIEADFEDLKRFTNRNGVLKIQIEASLDPRIIKFDENGKCANAVLLARGQRFYVLKQFLSSQCATFARMFNGPFVEASRYEIPLPDINPVHLQYFLEFVYRVDVISEHTIEGILELGDIYECERAQHQCEEFLLERSRKDWNEKFVFAVKFRLEKLKTRCLANIKTFDDLENILPADIEEIDVDTLDLLLKKSLGLHTDKPFSPDDESEENSDEDD